MHHERNTEPGNAAAPPVPRGVDELRELLEAQRDERDRLKREGVICRWVIHRDGKPIKSYDTAWRTACRKAGARL